LKGQTSKLRISGWRGAFMEDPARSVSNESQKEEGVSLPAQ
jgi:hypothetical protein